MFDQTRGKLRAIVAGSVLALTLGSVNAPARADHGADIIGPAIAFLALGTILQQGHQHRHYKYYKRYKHYGHPGYKRHYGHHGYKRHYGHYGYPKKHHRRHSHSHGDYYAYKRKHRKHRYD